jgi:hypothetical protein
MTSTGTSAIGSLSDDELDILAKYFGMGKGSEITSHPPHATIDKKRAAFDRLFAVGVLIKEPVNDHGVIRITCTDEAAEAGRARMKVLMAKALGVEVPIK